MNTKPKTTLTQYATKHGVAKAAKRIGVSVNTMSRHLNGHGRPRGKLTLDRLAALGIDLTNYPGEPFQSKYSPYYEGSGEGK